MNRYASAIGGFLINLFLFTAVLVLFHANYNSGSDGWLAYAFSGGFGVSGTPLVEYAWGWHIILAKVVSWLFNHSPHVNWYSWFLIVLHFTACVSVCAVLIERFGKGRGTILFTLFFLFFEAAALLSLTFSNTSILLAVAGNFVFVHAAFNAADRKVKWILVGSVLVVIGALLRFHTWGLVELLFIPFFLRLKYSWKALARIKGTHVSVVVLCYIIHVWYYNTTLPGWKSDEFLRQHQYSLANRPIDSNKVLRLFPKGYDFEFIYKGFLFGKSPVISASQIEKTEKVAMPTRLTRDDFFPSVKWHLTNNRIGLLFVLCTFMFCAISFGRKDRGRSLWYAAFLLMVLLVFLVFFKIPPYLVPTLLMTYWLFTVSLLDPVKLIPVRAITVIVLLAVMWLPFRLHRISQRNETRNHALLRTVECLGLRKPTIFVSTFASLLLEDFSIFDSPNDYPVVNYLSGSQMPGNVLDAKLSSFQIPDLMAALSRRSDLLLLGDSLNTLSKYYQDYHHIAIKQQPVTDSVCQLKTLKIVVY